MSNPSDTAVTVRPSATSIFAFDSDDRYKTYPERRLAPSYPFEVLIQKGEALLTGFFKRIGLTELRLNWSLPNIATPWGNNQINLVYIGTSAITSSTGSGTIQTYTANNTFVAGQVVSVTGISVGYNVTNATILTATSTNFTVAGGTTGTVTTPGVARLCLSSGVSAATATTTGGVTSITYTASFSSNYSVYVGQLVRQVVGLSPAGFNITNLRVTAVGAGTFTVALPAGTVLSGSSTGTGNVIVGLTRQVTLDDGFYSTTNIATYLPINISPVIPGFVALPITTDENIISFQAPNFSGEATQYEYYFDTVNVPVQYGTGPVTAALGGSGTVTYTCGNNFTVGQTVTVTGLNISSGASLNVTGVITAASTTQFTIANAAVGASTATQAGTATATATNIYPNISPSVRQLFDMMNLPYASTYSAVVRTGALNLRAMDYTDVVCNQLTTNQRLRDSSSLPVVRDVMARVYLDESLPSQSPITSRTYGLLSPTSVVLTALQSQTFETAIFTTSTAVTAALINTRVTISGIGGFQANGWNSPTTVPTGTITSVDVNTPFAVTITYDEVPNGIPTFSGSSIALSYVSTPTDTRQLSTWDDRMNGVTPFVIYRQYANPKEIRWSGNQPLSNCIFTLYDDQGRSIQDLWSSAYPMITNGTVSALATRYANGFVWNITCLLSED
jgi:hypothetical protein